MGELKADTAGTIGDFSGHLFAGSFCFIFGLSESTKCILKYLCKKQKKTYYSKTLFYKLEILEGILIFILALTGICGSLLFTGGSHLPLYEGNHWNKLKDWHHSTVYLFIGLVGVANILCFTVSSLPVSLTKLMMSNAFFVEAFIFYNHTYGRVMVDMFMHNLVGLVSFVTGLVAFIELLTENNILLELLRSNLILLQGSWFFQIAYVLFPPEGKTTWDLMDHDTKMFLSMCFCWYCVLAYIIIGVNYAFVAWLMKLRMRRLCSSEVGLLQSNEYEQELEEEI
ncbi:PREDICTED: transmembrane protein 45A-like [Chinchilla lanigera]|uniref:Transmembrane protein 45A-like n=1 Tax=Chinchilla lanigera TaxID=34839 RepID=A0A8C2VM49_CHILA|nr:PREDICTED: transmembrane protein 45A-like [Chinchilla lanigera]